MAGGWTLGGRGVEGRRPRRRWGAVAVSLLAHAVLLAALGLAVPELRVPPFRPAPPDLTVTLERPSPVLEPGAPSLSSPRPRARLTATVTALPPILHRPVERVRQPAAPLPPPAAPVVRETPAPPSPALTPSAPSPAIANGSPTPGLPRNGSGGPVLAPGLRGFGRATLGCDTADLARLTRAERERCGERFGAEARKGPPGLDGMAPEKRLAFDLAAARQRKCRFYETPVPMTTTRDRNDRVFAPFEAVRNTPESQHGESKANQPEDSLAHRLDCLP